MSNDTRLRRTRDPFALARSLFGYDPFYALQSQDSKPNFLPTFEVKETEEGYVLSADLPGVKEDDIDISLHNNLLTVSGTRKAEERREGETYFVYERQYGSFSRSFSLPDEANADAISAGLDGGVLTVKVGKKAESRPRKISIKK